MVGDKGGSYFASLFFDELYTENMEKIHIKDPLSKI